MRVSDINSSNSVKVDANAQLPNFIRTITVESAEEEQQVRLFLMGALKIDEEGCHTLGRAFDSVKAMKMNSIAISSLSHCAERQTLDDKLKIMESLTTALNYGENIDDDNRKLLSKKLKTIDKSL